MTKDNNSKQIKRFYKNHFYSNSKIPTKIVAGLLIPEQEYLLSQIEGGKSVIDICCGDGRVLKYLEKRTSLIYGIDYIQKQCELAKKAVPNARIINADAIKVPFKDCTFDYVLCTFNTFGNLGSKKDKSLQEMIRICKIQGKVIITVYSKKALPYQLEFYKNCGLEITNAGDGLVQVREGLISERFSQKELSDFCSQVTDQFKIKELSNIAYLLEVRKIERG